MKKLIDIISTIGVACAIFIAFAVIVIVYAFALSFVPFIAIWLSVSGRKREVFNYYNGNQN